MASPWASHRFGPLADELGRLIPEALGAAVNRALDGHEAAGMHTDHAFGTARWALQYEEMVRHLGHLPGAQAIRAPHAFYELVVIQGQLFVPWRYADHPVRMEDHRTVRPPSRLALDLIARFGPEPRWYQPRLPITTDADADDERDIARVTSLLDELDPPPQVVIVGFACNSTAGLMAAGWGEAAVGDDRSLQWLYSEPLPLPVPRIPRQREGEK